MPANTDLPPRRNAYLVWDGADEVTIPPPMLPPPEGVSASAHEALGGLVLLGEDPSPPRLRGRMGGTTAERLCELAGRVCFDPATELLTKTGWVRLDQLERGHEVATYNARLDRMEFQVPTDYIQENYSGPMYRINTKVSLFVTPNHLLFVGKGSSWHLLPAENVKGKAFKVRRHALYDTSVAKQIELPGRSYTQKNANQHSSKTVTRHVECHIIDVHQLPAWAALLGWYFSEGHVSHPAPHHKSAQVTTITQRESSSAPIYTAAEACGFPTRTYRDPRRPEILQIRVGGSTLARYLDQFGRGSRNKKLPNYVFDWPINLREILLDALMAGDGTISRHGTRVYNTNSKMLADDVQRLMISLGRPSNFNYSRDKTSLMYRIRETQHRKTNINARGVQDEWVPYDGKVWCVSVPNHILFTRRDDKVVLAGNCYDSLNAEKARDSDGYHAHIREVGHLSTIEHCPFTVSIPWTHEHVPACLLNRPGLWVERSMTRLRLTANLRTAAEWFKVAEEGGQVDGVLVRIGACLQLRAHELAPRVVNLSEDWTASQSELARIEDPIIQAPVVPPTNDHERWISLYMRGSRGFSHELVRHGDWTAISQRSTRYCDETESPWIEHPLVTAWSRREDPLTAHEVGFHPTFFLENYHLIKDSKNHYSHLVASLQAWLLSRGVDKHSARKQARGAARGYLGNALETELIFSASVAQWRHMLRMRASDAADAEIRAVFCEALPILKASRYGSSFGDMELAPARDGIGMALKDGGAR